MKPRATIILVNLFAAFLYVASMTTSEGQSKRCDTACIEEAVAGKETVAPARHPGKPSTGARISKSKQIIEFKKEIGFRRPQ